METGTRALATPDDPFLMRHLPGTSPKVVRLRQLVGRLNASKNMALIRVILIRGESGAGKNWLAQVIAAHRRWVQVKDTTEDPGLEAGLAAYTDRYGEIHLPSLPEPLIESE